MTEKQRASELVNCLEQQYPVLEHCLNYNKRNAWQLVVAVRLSAQCTDARVNMVTPSLFERYPSPEALACADADDIEEMIRSCGLGKSKARDIKGSMKAIAYEHDGCVPDTMQKLLSLPGVGRKSANLILGDVFGQPAVVCDTHCIRICNRMGLIDTKDPAGAEKRLRDLLPPERSNDFCHRLVVHGRIVCTARKAHCEKCLAISFCRQRLVQDGNRVKMDE